MNLKTTLALVLLLAAGVGLAILGIHLPEALDPLAERRTAAPSKDKEDSTDPLKGVTADNLQRIEIQRGKVKTVLNRTKDGQWVMPGNWPTRPREVADLVSLLGNLHSRFTPLAIEEKKLADYGLKPPKATIKLRTKKGKYTLALGEGKGEGDRFDRPTYLRVDDRLEVLRLGAGILNLLDRPADYYQQRRLFPVKRESGLDESASSARVERVAGRRIEVIDKGIRRLVLVKDGDDWALDYPVRDAVDPVIGDRLRESLAGLWAERFLPSEKAKNLADLGLDKPERELRVTR